MSMRVSGLRWADSTLSRRRNTAWKAELLYAFLSVLHTNSVTMLQMVRRQRRAAGVGIYVYVEVSIWKMFTIVILSGKCILINLGHNTTLTYVVLQNLWGWKRYLITNIYISWTKPKGLADYLLMEWSAKVTRLRMSQKVENVVNKLWRRFVKQPVRLGANIIY